MYVAFPSRVTNTPAAPLEIYEVDDFPWGGVATTGAAAIPANNTFGSLGWRVSTSGGAASAVTLVTTGQSSSKRGVVQIDVGTGAGAVIGIFRAATSTPTTIFGTGQMFEWEFEFQIPTLSTGAQEFTTRVGFAQSAGAAPTDGVVLETTSAAGPAGNIIGAVYKGSARVAATGGSTVAAVAGQWHRGRGVWDGSTQYFYVDDIFVGSCASADMPTAAIGEMASIQRTAGGTARTALVNKYQHLLRWAS